jgi:hypothetical protein
MIPESVESDTIKTVVEAHEDMATWLVGSRGPLGGAGGESEAFENDVVAFIDDELTNVARGSDTPLLEGNWFRRVSVTQTQVMGTFASDTRLGLSALGNAAGRAGDTYDQADRESQQALADAADTLGGFAVFQAPAGG